MTSLLSGAFPTSVPPPPPPTPYVLEQGCGETEREMLWKSPESGESQCLVVRDVKAV